MKHTQTPWALTVVLKTEKDMSGVLNIRSGDENVLAMTPRFGTNDQDNAEFIVKACNSHEALVAALQLTVDVFNQKEIDPLMAFIAIERAKQTLANLDK